MERFGQQQLVMALIGMMSLVAGGFLFLLFKSPVPAPADSRLPDFAAERAAGTLRGGLGEKKPAKVVEKVDIEGEFTRFDGKPGETVEQWPYFRGADYSNIVDSKVALAKSWPDGGPPKLWEIELGEGYAGPAVWKGVFYISDYDEEKQGDALRAFSMDDGREIWRRFYRNPIKANHGYSRTVPAVNEDFVVSIGPACHVLCVSRETGDFRWGIDMVADYGAKVPLWYTGQCPLIDGNTAVLAPGGSALMMGVDMETGEVLWETPNPNAWKMSHSSIMPMTVMGKKTYVYAAIGGVVGVSAEDGDRGAVLWETNQWTHSVTSPSAVAIDDKRIFFTVGYGGGSMMLGLREESGKIVAEPIYELDKKVFACEQQTPIFFRDHLFSILPKDASAMRGQFVCMNPDGEVVWSSGKKNRYGLGPFLLANGMFYILDDHGELTLIKESLQGFEPLARAEVIPDGHDAWGPMVLVDGKLILRDSKRMVCLDVAEP